MPVKKMKRKKTVLPLPKAIKEIIREFINPRPSKPYASDSEEKGVRPATP
jgi:hypothetical protein